MNKILVLFVRTYSLNGIKTNIIILLYYYMRVLLVTIAIGERYLEIYNYLFRKSQEDYAKKHGYDFKVVTDYLQKDSVHPSSISFHKILVCSQEWSKDYDYIIFIDADILINIRAPSILESCDFGDNIGIADEYSQPTKEGRIKIQKRMGWETSATDYYKLCDLDIVTDKVFNTGVLVLQPNKHREFLENIFNTYVERTINHRRGFHYEQSVIGYEIQKAENFVVLPNKFNSVWGIYKLHDPTHNLLRYFEGNHFIHFAGKADFEKVPNLHKYNLL